MQPVVLTPLGLDSPAAIEQLYAALGARRTGAAGPLLIDLAQVRFVRADGILTLVTAARLWHRWTGQRTVLCAMQPQVHRYLERMDLFTQCHLWLDQEYILPLSERFDRSPTSYRLLEVVGVSGVPFHNSDDVRAAIQRARRILQTWFDATDDAVDSLLTMLAEIATNVVHSQDYGFASVQRYDDRSGGALGSRVILAMADLGIGIEASLRSNPARLAVSASAALTSGSDYIRHAMTLGVTSRNTTAGLGLYQVHSIVEQWNGVLSIRSVDAAVRFEGGRLYCQDHLTPIPGTQVTITVRGPSTVEREAVF
jgi:hypothetical protein